MKKLILLSGLFIQFSVFGQTSWNPSGPNTATTGFLGVGIASPTLRFDVRANEANHVAYFYNSHSSGYGAVFRATDYPLRVQGPLGSSGAHDYLIVRGSGNVGIGYNSPAFPLVVHSYTTTPAIAIGLLGADTGGKSRLIFYAGTAASQNGFSIDYKASNVEDRLVFTDGGAVERMSILHGGKVGIGTAIPDEMLTVKGKIHAQEVRVDLSVPGPDYVFAPDYKLPSIEQVKAYIDEYHHLPEVPSAKEMEANGVEVGEMNMLLLKKIEELTLYVIDLKAQVDELKKKH